MVCSKVFCFIWFSSWWCFSKPQIVSTEMIASQVFPNVGVGFQNKKVGTIWHHPVMPYTLKVAARSIHLQKPKNPDVLLYVSSSFVAVDLTPLKSELISPPQKKTISNPKSSMGLQRVCAWINQQVGGLNISMYLSGASAQLGSRDHLSSKRVVLGESVEKPCLQE